MQRKSRYGEQIAGDDFLDVSGRQIAAEADLRDGVLECLGDPEPPTTKQDSVGLGDADTGDRRTRASAWVDCRECAVAVMRDDQRAAARRRLDPVQIERLAGVRGRSREGEDLRRAGTAIACDWDEVQLGTEGVGEQAPYGVSATS